MPNFKFNIGKLFELLNRYMNRYIINKERNSCLLNKIHKFLNVSEFMKPKNFVKSINQKKQSNIYRLFRSYILVIFVLLIVMFSLTSKIQQNLINSWMIENVNKNLVQANEYVDNTIFSIPDDISRKILQHAFETSILSYYFYCSDYKYSNTKYIQDYLRSFMTSNNIIKNISFYYENDNYFISPLSNRQLTKDEYEKQFSELLIDSSYHDPFYWIYVGSVNLFAEVSNSPYAINSSDAKYLYFIRKIPRVAFSSNHGGAIIISINENIFHNKIQNFFSAKSEVFLTSLDGTILLSSNKAYVLRSLSSFGINSSKINTNLEQGYFTEKINGINTLVFYKKSTYSNYMYIVFFPIDEITSNFFFLLKLLAIVTFLTFILGIALSFYSVKVYSAPLLFLKNMCASILKRYSPKNSARNEYEIINFTVDILSNKLNEQENSIRDVSPLLLEYILLSLISKDSATTDKINKLLRIAGINFDKEAYIIAIFKAKYDNRLLVNNPFENPEHISREISEIISQYFMDENVEYISAKINSYMVFLFNFECENNNMMPIFQNISEHISKFTRLNIYISISDICYTPDDINIIYEHACDALNYSYLYPSKKVFSYDLMVASKKESPISLEQCINQMVYALQIHNWDYFNTNVDGLENLVCSKSFSYQAVIALLENLIVVIQNFAAECNINLDEIVENPENFIENTSNIHDFCKLMKDVINYISDIFERRSSNKNHELIEQVKTYVSKNITNNNISLELVSSYFGISSAHLSRVFKEITGENFVEFITREKLDYAKKQLLTTNLTVDSISKLIGYSNTQYFISKFKVRYGKTPNEFRLSTKRSTIFESLLD